MIGEIMENIKNRIFESCDKLYREFGVKKITVKQLCQEADINRVNFYKFFKDKYDCFFQWWLKQMDKHTEEMIKIFDSDASFTQKIDKFISQKKSHHSGYSQLFYTDLNILRPNDNPICQKKIEYINQRMIQFIISESEKMGIKQRFTADKLLCLYKRVMIDTMSDKEFSSFYSSVDDQSEDLLRFFFFGVIGQ
jgi:AcrR family transcriptional regulator